MYVHVLSTGGIVGASFSHEGLVVAPFDGIRREARTCRQMVGPSSFIETRGYGPLLPTKYQVLGIP